MHFKIWYFHELLFQIRSRATCLHLSATKAAGVYLILFSFETLPILLFCYSPDILNAYQALDTVRGSKRFGQEPCSTVWPARVWLTGQQLADLCHSNLVETKATFDIWKVRRISMQILLFDGVTVWNISGFFSFLVSSDWTLFA